MSKSEKQGSNKGILPDALNTTRNNCDLYWLTPERAEHWAHKQSWTQTEARRLARNYDPTLYNQRHKFGPRELLSSAGDEVHVRPLGKPKPNLGEQMRRARKRNLLHENPTPQEFIEWLDKIRYPAPDHLRRAVLHHNKKAADLRAEFYTLVDRLREEGLVTEIVKKNILEEFDTDKSSKSKINKAGYHRQEKKHLYGFVAAFAEQNGYKGGSKTADLEALAQSLQCGGLEIKSTTTMNKYIAEAYALYGSTIKKLKQDNK